MDALKDLEVRAEVIHKELGILHEQLADIAKRRDALILAEDTKAKSGGGTVIGVPAATIKAKGR